MSDTSNKSNKSNITTVVRNLQKLWSVKGFTGCIIELLTDVRWLPLVSVFILISDFILSSMIIYFVKYTEIDFSTYMQQVEIFLHGSRDYSAIKGATGPCVYPAGHLYTYSIIHSLTDNGSSVLTGQLLFLLVYLVNLAAVLTIYCKLSTVPPYVLLMSTFISYRIHSIFMLRLFNDAIAMTVFHISLVLFLSNKWYLASAVYSVSVGIKMNVLLFSPGLAVILVELLPVTRVLACLAICAVIQLLIGLPFLLHAPWRYLAGAFDLTRVFLYKWTVNWRFLPEDVFLSRSFHLSLLLLHLLLLAVYLYPRVVRLSWRRRAKQLDLATRKRISTTMFTVNLIGILCSRSLHYQFYVWYFYSIPSLLWTTQYPTVVRLFMMLVLESAWNTYPSTSVSSSLLVLVNFLIFIGLYRNEKRMNINSSTHS